MSTATATKIKKAVKTRPSIEASSMLNVNLGVSHAQRKKISDALHIALSDSYMLLVKLHNHHWNITGPQFGPLHQLFQAQYEELFIAIDDIAERIRTLGIPVQGTMEFFKKTSGIQESTIALTASQIIKDLVKGHEVVIGSLRDLAELASLSKDIESEDLAIERLRVHEKNAWLLISHLED